jgi:hypothetical protein
MRFDTPIYFQLSERGAYDAKSGDYGKDVVTETKLYADVTDAGVETINLVYGELRQGVKVVRLQTHYNDVFGRIRIGSRVYRVDLERRLRNKHVFVVSEVQ